MQTQQHTAFQSVIPQTQNRGAGTSSLFADYLARTRHSKSSEYPTSKLEPVGNIDLQAKMYRWIRSVALSNKQDIIVASLESISAQHIGPADFDAAILGAMAQHPDLSA